jgi:hypothetical protein
MAAARLVAAAAIGEDEGIKLIAMTRSRPGAARRIAPARRLLADRDDPSFLAVGHAVGPRLGGHQPIARRSFLVRQTR